MFFSLALALQLSAVLKDPPLPQIDTIAAEREFVPRLLLPHSWDEDRLRTQQLIGVRPSAGYLLRSASSGAGMKPHTGSSYLELIPARIQTVWHSDLPFSLNDGALWAGRGLSSLMSAGIRARLGPVVMTIAPEFIYQQNLDYQTFSYPEPSERVRHPLSSPFHYPPESVDLPLRFGHTSSTRVEPGQSSLAIELGPIAIGAATENLWWGPGIRNAIVMSSNAPGIPHLFARTLKPIDLLGWRVDGVVMAGSLSESEYFDYDPANDSRSISAIGLTFTPCFEPDLTVGAARAVYGTADGPFPAGAVLDVLRSVPAPQVQIGDSTRAAVLDQLFSVFARWVFPKSGFEAYLEWARYEQPTSLRDFLEMPGHSQGYTIGTQWAAPVHWQATLRLHAEATYLEPSPSFRVRDVYGWYTSRAVPQGYTHQGQTIGAAVGPGGSGQWISADLLHDRWRTGAFFGRIRWENQAQFTYLPEYRYADVSLFGGIRAAYDFGIFQADLEASSGMRYNYLFQAQATTPRHHRGVDILNHRASLTLSTGSSPF